MTNAVYESPATCAADMELAGSLFGGWLSAPASLPVSYSYGGKQYRGLPEGSAVSRRLIDAAMLETVFAGRLDENVRVKAECLSYKDFPAAEWTLYFENTGSSDSANLCGLNAADIFFGAEAAHAPVLVHNNGDFYSADGYTETRLPLGGGVVFKQSPSDGRSCNEAFPYQRLLFGGYGLNISIGWPGQWECEYRGTAGGVAFTAGQQGVDTYIKPGELFRSPRMTFVAFCGDEARGINVWRRFFNAHVTPRRNGGIVAPILITGYGAGDMEASNTNEKRQLEGIALAKEYFPEANLWWMDAGWYACKTSDCIAGADPAMDEDINADINPGINYYERHWPHTGDWRPAPARFPNGLAPIGEACRDAGMDLLVWFEPERVRRGTKLFTEHSEWMLAKDYPLNYLLNIADPACLKWLCETISSLIKESGINCYRQDFNFSPLQYWQQNTPPGRDGMLENQYVQAYLAFWDYLLADNPGLWIDSCASGGRRNDLETMRRSVPLHPTDYGYGYHHINQAFRHTLCAWLPYVRSWSGAWDRDNEYYSHDDYYAPGDAPELDKFSMINGFGVTNVVSVEFIQALPECLPYVHKMNAVWKRFSQIMLHGDFYALTENHRDNKKWTVFQFDCPERGTGALQALRNNQCADGSITVMLCGLSPNSEYLFTNDETGESFTIRSGDVAPQATCNDDKTPQASCSDERAPQTACSDERAPQAACSDGKAEQTACNLDEAPADSTAQHRRFRVPVTLTLPLRSGAIWFYNKITG